MHQRERKHCLYGGMKHPNRTGIAAGIVLTCAVLASCVPMPTNATCESNELLEKIHDLASIESLVRRSRGQESLFETEAIGILSAWIGRNPPPPVNSRQAAKDMRAAIRDFTTCSASGSAAAHFLLGAYELRLKGKRSNLNKAFSHFDKSVQGGMLIGYLGKAAASYETNKVPEADRALQALMKADDRFRAETAGLMLWRGKILPKNAAFAKPWLELAATRDNSADAQRALLEMYSTGEGVPRNESEAKKWRAMLEKNPAGARDWEEEQRVLEEINSDRPPPQQR